MIEAKKIPFADGLQFVPAGEDKVPYLKEWQITRRDYDFTDTRCKVVGLVCGEISGNVEAIDIDCKYDLSGTLFEDYRNTIHSLDKNLLKKLVVCQTRSGGYHFVYRCKTITTSKKLANRYCTEAEKKAGDKSMVLIETRGNRSYIACFPTPGYSFKYGDFSNIQFITEQERETLFFAAQSFNEVVKEYKPPVVIEHKFVKGLRPSEDYNRRGEVLSLLMTHGWLEVGRRGKKILMRRPGKTDAFSSGHFDEEDRRFSVFSTSTDFEANTRHQPWAVFAILECKGDFKEATIKLSQQGFGDSFEVLKANNAEIPSVIDTSDEDDLSFFATPDDYDNYLNAWRTKTFEMGKSTGIPELDAHFLFKEGNLVIVNGIDNVGKSSVVWYLGMLSSLYHNWNWIIFSSENRVGGVIRKLIEFYWCEPIDEMTDKKYQIAKKYVEDHFSIIKCGESMFNYTDILKMTRVAMKHKQYKGLMIDPYNSLKIDIAAGSKQQIYDYHYEAASVIQLFAKNNNISIYLNCHVGTIGARNKDKSGYTKAPQKEDTEGGVMFSNKADEFLTVHRITQHETDWRYTEIHVRKVKETETGGRVTYFYKPIDLTMINSYTGFISVPVRGQFGTGTNAVLAFHSRNNVVQLPIHTTIDITESRREQEEEFVIKHTDESDELPF
jgi:hypothetical protein